MPDANDTNETNEHESKLDRLFAGARENLAQFESGRGMTPHQFQATDDTLPRDSWPTMIYIMPSGEVIARREQSMSTVLAHQSMVVFKVKPLIEPGNSGGGQACKLEVIKFRGDMHDFFRSVAQAFLTSEESEKSLLKAIFPNAKTWEIESLTGESDES